jgi:cytochrome d ubiquinol oxidase subunit II
MAILFCFIVQAISYEFRSKPNNFLGKKTYEVFLFVNGALGTILIGTAVGTFFNGSMFSVNEMNFSGWETRAHGLEAVLNWHNVALGLTVFFLARILGLFFFMKNVDDEEVYRRSKKHLMYNAIPFLVFFLAFVIRLVTKEGFAYDPVTYEVFMEDFKYLHNLMAMPLVLIFFLVGVVAVLFALYEGLFTSKTRGFYFISAGTILVVFSLFIIAGMNKTCYYPSIFDLQSSLHIENSSSSEYTLTAMSWVSLFVPGVLAYIYFAWKALTKKKISSEELSDESHVY